MSPTAFLRAGARSNTIGFIGLGAMGAHMFTNLAKRHTVNTNGIKPKFVVCDVNRAAVASALKGISELDVDVQEVENAEQVALNASTILSMVPTSHHVKDVYTGKLSIMRGLQQLDHHAVSETICLDSSTIEQSESKSIALSIRSIGAEMMDTPVSGGVVGAEKGTLAIMAGGGAKAFAKAEPVLHGMAKKVTHCGELGAGLAAKIANNLLLGITMLGLSEAMLLGKSLGLNPQVLANIIHASTGRCWSNEINNPVPSVVMGESSPPAHREYEGGFVSKLTHKDLRLAVDAACTTGTPLQLGNLTEQMYRPLSQSKEWGNLDFSAIYKYLSENNYTEGIVMESRGLGNIPI